jgi:hypothetical protein
MMPVKSQPSSKQFAESISGLIERVTFHNDDTGFGVLKVIAKTNRDLVTVVGSLPSVHAGEWLTANGLTEDTPWDGRCCRLRTDTATRFDR